MHAGVATGDIYLHIAAEQKIPLYKTVERHVILEARRQNGKVGTAHLRAVVRAQPTDLPDPEQHKPPRSCRHSLLSPRIWRDAGSGWNLKGNRTAGRVVQFESVHNYTQQGRKVPSAQEKWATGLFTSLTLSIISIVTTPRYALPGHLRIHASDATRDHQCQPSIQRTGETLRECSVERSYPLCGYSNRYVATDAPAKRAYVMDTKQVCRQLPMAGILPNTHLLADTALRWA